MSYQVNSWRWYERAQGWVASAGGIAVLSKRRIEEGPPTFEVTDRFIAEVVHDAKRRAQYLEPDPEMSEEEFRANWRALVGSLSDDHINHIYEAIS